jgi:hypothetical protein
VEFFFDAELWLWEARRDDGWTFLSLPEDASDLIRERAAGSPRGFGSVPVRVSIGTSTWQTSVFPDSARGVYVLPIKKAVRRAQGIEAGDIASVTVEVAG